MAVQSRRPLCISYSLGHHGNLFFTFADRGRFPMLKDIYSTSLGAGLPNPNLQPERSRSWNIGYTRPIGTTTLVELVLFRSDLRDAIESVYVTDPGGRAVSTAFCPSSKIIRIHLQRDGQYRAREVHQGVWSLKSAQHSRCRG